MNFVLTPLRLPLRVIPEPLHAALLARLFNHLLRGQRLQSRLVELDNKSVLLRITDVPCELMFMIEQGRLRACNRSSADVMISGQLTGFLQLASGSQDPDTLFFQRRLNIEGETETGVHVKNLLDSLDYDWDAHFDAVLFPALAKRAKLIRRRVRRHLPVDFVRRILNPGQ